MRPIQPISMSPKKRSLRAFGHARDGGIAVTVAVMTAVLVGVLALSIDLGRLYNSSTERTNAADAAAVAAATQLNGEAGACARAIDAAIAADFANQETFASNRTGPDVYISPIGGTTDGGDPTTNPNIRFLSDLVKDDGGNVVGTYITDTANCDSTASFVEVTTDLVAAGQNAQVEYYFAGIVSALTSAFPRGYAVAEYPRASCALAPMMMCSLSDPGQEWYDEVANYQHTGKGLWLKAGENNTQWGPGNFGFLRIGGIQGANDLADAMGMVNPPFDCLGAENDFSTKPGANESVRRAFNTRFDMFQNMTSEQNDPQYQPSPNPVKGLLKSGNQCGLTGNGYTYPSPEYDGPVNTPAYAGPAMPLPKDKCAYGGVSPSCIPIPGVDPGRMGDGDWESDVYLNVNHPTFVGGVADILLDDPNWDISWPGVGKDGKMSRYEMYLWEMGRYHSEATYGVTGVASKPTHLVDNTGGDPTPPQTGEYGDLQCFNPAMMGNVGGATLLRDRRVMEVLVVDCANVPGGVKGNTDLNMDRDVVGTIQVFLVEPWKVNAGGGHEIYTEIIGPGEEVDESIQLQTVKKWINLKESRQARP